MTLWRPDTCGCAVEYDDNIQVIKVHKKCHKHASTPDDATHLETMLAHNRKKNAIVNTITAHLGSIPKGMSVVYDANDDLHVAGDGLSQWDRDAVLGKVATSLGASKLNWIG